jgi:hypothetical protein
MEKKFTSQATGEYLMGCSPLSPPTLAIALPASASATATTTAATPHLAYDPSKPRGKQRYSADTNDWAEAIKKAGEAQKQRAPIQRVTVEKAIDLCLIDRSKRAKSAKDAPFKDRYMLRDGSKKQQALLNQRFSESQF